jgi:DNA-binding Xre family transcriptional regulator
MGFSPVKACHEKIARALIKGSYNFRELQEKCGIDKGTLSRMKHKKAGITLDHLKQLAPEMDCYPSDFLPDDWVRKEDGAGINKKRVRESALKIFAAYAEVREKFGEFASPERLADVMLIMCEDETGEISKEQVTTAMKALKTFGSAIKGKAE